MATQQRQFTPVEQGMHALPKREHQDEARPEFHLDSFSFRLHSDGLALIDREGKMRFVPRREMDKIALAWIEWTMRGYLP